MYNRYKQSAIQGLTINEQVARILGDINRDLQKSDQLFRVYDVAQSIEIGEKAIYKAIMLSSIVDKYADDLLEKPDTPEDLRKGLVDLKLHFEILHKTITTYVTGRSEKLLARVLQNLKSMENFWKAIPAPENDSNEQHQIPLPQSNQTLGDQP